MTVIGKWDEYTFELELINNDSYSPNRIVKAYKNGEDVSINTLLGVYNEKEDYKLATWNSLISNIRCISYRQVRSATNYKIQLTSGILVFASEKII